ncbi:asparagine--tRNA ligase-like, partial [Penaeus monodon]|uniref:asparagine--tRNA ligase-like n=1 Tax=Penaeus monodon TaxID=6687 RepID=UPI0018A7B001
DINAKLAVQEYFNKEHFINIDTPILTANDCEGGGEVFLVQVRFNQLIWIFSSTTLKKVKKLFTGFTLTKYFGHPAYLTVSGQLHLEAMASGLSKVYISIQPFRAENSQTRRHLAEFWMVEAVGSLSHSILVLWMVPIVEILNKKSLLEIYSHCSLIQWTSVTHDFSEPNMQQQTVFVTDWPKKTKAFYMRQRDDNSDVVLGVDLLLPGIGEVAGGGLREDRPQILRKELDSRGLIDNLQWYLDLRTFGGGAPSGGFGIGFERLLLFVLGVDNIKDVIPFPRWGKHCSC